MLRQMGVVVVVGAVGGGWEGLTQGVGEIEGGVRTSSWGPLVAALCLLRREAEAQRRKTKDRESPPPVWTTLYTAGGGACSHKRQTHLFNANKSCAHVYVCGYSVSQCA